MSTGKGYAVGKLSAAMQVCRTIDTMGFGGPSSAELQDIVGHELLRQVYDDDSDI